MRGEVSSVDERAKAIIQAKAKEYIRQVLSAIQECGMDYRAMPLILLGGGASLFKRHAPPSVAPYRLFLLDDDKLNAKGFARLCARLSERDGDG